MTATLTFDDEFNTLSLWNGTSGTWDTNYWYNPLNGNGGSLPTNGEQEWYINSNDPATSSVKPWSVSNGILTIQAAAASPSVQPLINNYQYTSGEINTHNSFSQQYGYFEMRAQLPAGQGLWPAFWLLPEDGSWPPEIDIMEMLGNNPTMLYTTDHTEVNGTEINQGTGTTVANMSTGYHTYAVDWEPDYTTFYFDNQQVYKIPTPASMNKPMYMTVNLAVGGGWPGNVDPAVLPANMKVDWVHVYTSNPYTSGGATTGGTTGSTGGATSTGTGGTHSDPPPSTGGTGTTLTANDTAGQVLTGTSGNDTFVAGHNSVVMTGNGGSDTFVFNALPWNVGQITDFNPSTDKIDVSGLLKAASYTGTNPFGDGTLSLTSDGHGGTTLMYHGSAATVPIAVVDIDNVAASSINIANDFVTGLTNTASSGSTSSGGSSGTSTSSGSTSGSTSSTGSTTAGITLTGNDTAGQVLSGTTGNDTFNAGHNSVVMTGDGGADTFVFNALPWNAGQITDFSTTLDKIDVSGLLKAANYAGTNPFGDGTLTLTSDGHSGTTVTYHGAAATWPTSVVDIDNVAPSAINVANDFKTGLATTSGTTTTSGSTTTTPGITLTGNDTAGQVLTGTGGNDTFNAGHNSVVMTGEGGSDTFVFNYQPWNAGHITDFNTTLDKINVAGLLHDAGYTGTSPLSDGTISLIADGNGGTNVTYNPPASAANHWPIKIVDLDHVAPLTVHATDFIFH